MTIADFSRDAVCKYLRSVVLVDDNVFNTPRITIADETLSLDGVPVLAVNGGDASSDVAPDLGMLDGGAQNEGTLQSSDDNQVDARAVTNGFAREGIVCGVYKPCFFPQDGFENVENFKTLLNVCKNADVFILDWHLFSENENAVALLLGKISYDDNCVDSPRPVRFCAIYTAERVDSVCDAVYAAIAQAGVSARKDAEARKVYAGGLTVCVYAKEEATSSGAIAAQDLACRIITDFAKTYDGILPSLALRGIASIRDNAKRILDKFPAGMDPAFVLHAGLTIRGKNISQDVATLMGDEVSAILEDEREQDDNIYTLCDQYVGSCSDSTFDKTGDDVLEGAIVAGSTGGDVKRYIQNVFVQQTLFPKDEGGVFRPVFKKCSESEKFSPGSRLVRALGKLVARKTDPTGMYKFGALSALFCHRTNYSGSKMLRFGIVVKELSSEERNVRYYLCLMPLCDCIRLADQDETGHLIEYKFPFWELTEIPNEPTGKNHGLVLKGTDGDFHPYCAKGKIRESFMLFGFNARNSVVSFDRDNVVKTADGERTFEWVAELKSAHIQRMAEFVSREFSRVGLTESEWLRLQVDR